MTAKRVIFIEPSASKTNVFDNYMRLPLMGSLYLGTILHENGYQVRILNESILGHEIDPYELTADIFCITALTGSASRARFIAASLKSIYPKSTVLVGGIHASLVPEEFTDVADHVVVGEAEDIILDIVEGKYEEKIIQCGKVTDMSALPLVRYDLLEEHEKLDIVPLMTSRGCPFPRSKMPFSISAFGTFSFMTTILRPIEKGLKIFATL